MLRNTEAIIFFILFSHQFSDRSYSRPSSYYFPTDFTIVPMSAI